MYRKWEREREREKHFRGSERPGAEKLSPGERPFVPPVRSGPAEGERGDAGSPHEREGARLLRDPPSPERSPLRQGLEWGLRFGSFLDPLNK